MRIFYLIIILFIFLIGLTFALQNAEPVTLHYYIGSSIAPLSLWLMSAVGVGILWGMLFFMGVYIRLRRTILSLNRRLRAVEKS